MPQVTKLKGLGPIKLGPVEEQFNFNAQTVEIYVKFAGKLILIARNFLEPNEWWRPNATRD